MQVFNLINYRMNLKNLKKRQSAGFIWSVFLWFRHLQYGKVFSNNTCKRLKIQVNFELRDTIFRLKRPHSIATATK